jgi:XTP/dITP diphosphohydrolase
MEGVQDRSASFTTAIAFADTDGIQVFSGTIHGTITPAPRGREGFGYDPIFEYNGTTLAELPLAEKNRISHRAKALGAFHDWFIRTHSPSS